MAKANLPEMGPKARTAYEPIRVDVPKALPTKRAVYWFGMLPLEGEFEMAVPSKEPNEDGEYISLKKITARKLWAGFEERGWAGKAVLKSDSDRDSTSERKSPTFRTLQGASLGGIAFTAWTDSVERHDQEIIKTAYPGIVAVLTDEQIDKVIEKSTQIVLRNGQLTNLMQGEHAPIDPNDPFTRPYVPKLTPLAGDRAMAEFVYLVKLSVKPEDFRQSEWTAHCPMNMNEFFKSPPEMLAKHIEAVPA